MDRIPRWLGFIDLVVALLSPRIFQLKSRDYGPIFVIRVEGESSFVAAC